MPHVVVLYNSGLLLVVDDSPVLGDLHMLAESDVQILFCGLCLTHFDCEKRLVIGEITNMYVIAEMMQGRNVMRP